MNIHVRIVKTIIFQVFLNICKFRPAFEIDTKRSISKLLHAQELTMTEFSYSANRHNLTSKKYELK